MWANYVDLEKGIYLEALKNHNVYKEYLYSLFDDVDNSVGEYKKVSFKKIVNLINNLKLTLRNRTPLARFVTSTPTVSPIM